MAVLFSSLIIGEVNPLGIDLTSRKIRPNQPNSPHFFICHFPIVLQIKPQMLQIIFFAVLFGIALVLSSPDKTSSIKKAFDGLNEIIIKIVEIIMQYAPIGVFALLAGLIVDLAGDDPNNIITTLKPLLFYALTVIVGLTFMVFIFYPLIIYVKTGVTIKKFLKAIFPAQMLAFSTSSSAATLPLTMKRVEKNLNVSDEVTSFVCPLGATINMDGTSIHQAISRRVNGRDTYSKIHSTL